MNYLPRNKSKNSAFKKVAILMAILFVGGALSYFAGPVLTNLAAPLWKGENKLLASVSNSMDFFRSKQALLEENEALREKLFSLELQLASVSGAAQEQALLELLGRHEEAGGIPAAVLTRPPQTPYDILTIDAGEKDGIHVGDHVYLPEGPEIGTISEVFGSTARVRLYSSSKVTINAVLERHNIPVVLEGMGAGNFQIAAPREAEVLVGDRVLSPALGTVLLGVVEYVEVGQTDAFKKVLARSPASIFSIRTVLVRP